MTKRAKAAGTPAVEISRRHLLTAAAAVAGLTIAPGVILMAVPARAKPPGQPASSKVRWGMLIDTNKLDKAACDAMVATCNTYNAIKPADRPDATAQWIRRVDIEDPRTGFKRSLPVMCQHCEFPPCTDVCPTGASFRRADGIVLVDKHICIGCRYCMLACPYKARSFGYQPVTGQEPYAPRGEGTAEACTFCVDRIDAGQVPACVETAEKVAPGAVLFGDLKDPNSAISKRVSQIMVTRLRANLNVGPGVLYEGL